MNKYNQNILRTWLYSGFINQKYTYVLYKPFYTDITVATSIIAFLYAYKYKYISRTFPEKEVLLLLRKYDKFGEISLNAHMWSSLNSNANDNCIIKGEGQRFSETEWALLYAGSTIPYAWPQLTNIVSKCNNYGQCERMLRYTSLDPARVSMSRSWVLENRQMAFRCQTTTICLGNKTIYAYALPSFRFLRWDMIINFQISLN